MLLLVALLTAATAAATAASVAAAAVCAPASPPLTASNTENLGFSIAASNGLIFAGDRLGGAGRQGAVVVYKCASASLDNCVYASTALAPGGRENEQLGFSVAAEGSLMVAGAPHESGSVADQGAAHVFDCSSASGVCTHQARLVAADPEAGAYFGVSVAVSGEMVVMGANWDDSGATNEAGAAYVFRCVRSAVPYACSQMLKLRASSPSSYNFFGMGVAVWQTNVAVASASQTALFQCNVAATPWTCTQKTTVSGYANAVSLQSNVMVTGWAGFSNSDGRAIVYDCTYGTSWACTNRVTLLDPDTGSLGHFGESVVMVATGSQTFTVAIGATENIYSTDETDSAEPEPETESAAAIGGGTLTVFDCSSASIPWQCTERFQYQPSDGFAGDGFGVGVAIAADADAFVAGRPVGNDVTIVDCSPPPPTSPPRTN